MRLLRPAAPTITKVKHGAPTLGLVAAVLLVTTSAAHAQSEGAYEVVSDQEYCEQLVAVVAGGVQVTAEPVRPPVEELAEPIAACQFFLQNELALKSSSRGTPWVPRSVVDIVGSAGSSQLNGTRGADWEARLLESAESEEATRLNVYLTMSAEAIADYMAAPDEPVPPGVGMPAPAAEELAERLGNLEWALLNEPFPSETCRPAAGYLAATLVVAREWAETQALRATHWADGYMTALQTLIDLDASPLGEMIVGDCAGA